MLTLIQVHQNKKDTQDTHESTRTRLTCGALQARWDRQDMQKHMAPPLCRGKRAKNFAITSRAPAEGWVGCASAVGSTLMLTLFDST